MDWQLIPIHHMFSLFLGVKIAKEKEGLCSVCVCEGGGGMKSSSYPESRMPLLQQRRGGSRGEWARAGWRGRSGATA